jgi:hypothetical protein
MVTGKYTIIGGNLSLTTSTGQSNGMPSYCVQGNELDLDIWYKEDLVQHGTVDDGNTPVYAIYMKQ